MLKVSQRPVYPWARLYYEVSAQMNVVVKVSLMLRSYTNLSLDAVLYQDRSNFQVPISNGS